MQPDPANRFGDRVADYARARPGYPSEVFEVVQLLGIHAGDTIADVGSGTGIFSRQLIERGYRVIAIEPNDAMRREAEATLAASPLFTSVSGSAEATGLADESVDLVTVAQAFHWFDPLRAGAEFQRILRPDRYALIVWNITRWWGSPSADALGDIIIRYNLDLSRIDHRRLSENDEATLAFFVDGTAHAEKYSHSRLLSLDDLIAGVASASYMPNRDHPDFPAMEADLRELYSRHATEWGFQLVYDTKVVYGKPRGNT